MESEETLFIVKDSSINLNCNQHKTTFTGCLDSIRETNESSSAESTDIIIGNIDNLEDVPLRVSFSSDSSKLSHSICTTTDSLTNVTRVTVSSSEFSFDDSSKSGLSSDSSSNDHQWQNLWTEHVDQQYQLCYREYLSKKKSNCHNSNLDYCNYYSEDNVHSLPQSELASIDEECDTGKLPNDQYRPSDIDSEISRCTCNIDEICLDKTTGKIKRQDRKVRKSETSYLTRKHNEKR